VAATPHGDKQIVFTREGHGSGDIGAPGAAGDQRRPVVDHAVPDSSGLVVAVIAGEEQFSTQALRQSPSD
jgi:hypothetical protein